MGFGGVPGVLPAELYGISTWEQTSSGVRVSPIRVAQAPAIPTSVTGASWGVVKDRYGK